MKVNIFITPHCKAIIEQWANKKCTSFDGIVNVLIEYAFANDCLKPPIKISNAEEASDSLTHITVKVYNEDYISFVELRGKKALKLSRILEYLVTYEAFDERYLDYIDTGIISQHFKSKSKVTFNKFLIEEQTKIAMIPDTNIAIAKDAIFDNFDIVWPILKFANSRLNIKSELVDYIEKILTIKGENNET